jgi:hypothetical protein
MFIPSPNPQIYRRAAEFISSGREKYSCCAIERALLEVYQTPSNVRGTSLTSLYTGQYRAMFGPLLNGRIVFNSLGNGVLYFRTTFQGYISNHPFWNMNASEENQKCRMNALLFMAEICENP